MSFGKRAARIAIIGGVIFVLAIGALYAYIVSGGLVARQKPLAAEAIVTRWMLEVSLPKSAKTQTNPLLADVHSQDITAGGELYKQKCEICHGYDGGGETQTGGGLYPPPLDLRTLRIQKTPDGVLFYFIRNGIRNTAMPGWQMPDQDIWRLVLFIRNLPKVATPPGEAALELTKTVESAKYVGSAACESCHRSTYERWKKTRMANVVRDPREHPDAIIPDFSKPDPLLTFSKDDIALVYGSKWKQRYFKRVGDDYFPLPAQWDVTHKVWRAYNVKPGTDWWTPYYPEDNMHRPTGPTCDGCHSVNYDVSTKKVTEWNVGCEKCHGPGSEHVKQPTSANIINPSRLNYVDATDTCIQCHSQGQRLAPPSVGNAYDWPVGFHMGKRLDDFWKLEEHKLGETTFTHFADGTAHKNRMQGNDFVNSLMYARGVTCFSCHDTHGTDNDALLRKPTNVLCLDCHGPNSPNGPHAPTIEQHTHHKVGSQGSECIACHMPKIQQTIADVNVRSHTFHFVTPATTEALKIPNACNVCHSDKSTAWATAALKTWTDRSPWRIAE
ncbi:MAG: Multihem cytochrome [Bryobacterales bacterium]|nr:Multihem cytochrome [Bryobacterales bacterium]